MDCSKMCNQSSEDARGLKQWQQEKLNIHN